MPDGKFATLDNDDDACRVTNLSERIDRPHGTVSSKVKLERSEEKHNDAKPHPEVENGCSQLLSLANIQLLVSQPDAAKRVLDRALALADEWLVRDGDTTLEILKKLAELELQIGHKGRAKELAERLLASTQNRKGDASLETAEALELVASVHRASRRFGWADVHYRKALMIRENFHKGNDAGLANLVSKLGSLCYEMQDHKQAALLLRKALGLRSALGVATDAETAKIFQGLGDVCYATCQYKDSEKYLRKALKLFRKLMGVDSLEEASVRCDLSNVFSATHQFEKAEVLLKAALKVQSARLGYKDKSVKATLTKLSGVYHAQGKFDKSIELSTLVMETGMRADGS